MRRFIFVLVCGFFLSSCGMQKNLEAVDKKVDQFHKLYNNGEYREIYYVMASNDYKKAITSRKNTQFMTLVKKTLGNYSNKKMLKFNIQKRGRQNLVTIVYEVQFKKGVGTETFSFIQSGKESLQLFYYDISSPEIFKNGKDFYKLL